MSLKDAAYEMEDIQLKIWALSGLANAVSTAVIEGAGQGSDYSGALYILSNELFDLEKRTEDLTHAIFDCFRKAEGHNGETC